MPATPDWADLFDAPLDDEPFTEEEQAAADAALERIRQGDYVLLDDLVAEWDRDECDGDRSTRDNRGLASAAATQPRRASSESPVGAVRIATSVLKTAVV